MCIFKWKVCNISSACKKNTILARFRRLLKSQIHGSKIEQEDKDPEIATLLRQYFGSVMTAVIIQMLLHNIALVLQGLLAGLACGHCVFAFVFAEPVRSFKIFVYLAYF